MKKRGSLYAGIILLAASAGSHGDELQRRLLWEPPTTREDGTALTIDELQVYRLYSVENDIPQLIATAPNDARTMQVMLDGGRCYQLYLTAVDTDADESKPSNNVMFCSYSPSEPTELHIEIIRNQ